MSTKRISSTKNEIFTICVILVTVTMASQITEIFAGENDDGSAPVSEKSGVENGVPNFVMGAKFFPIPTIARPERGVAIIDPTFGTKITRITDLSDGWGKVRCHSYSTFSPYNCDDTLLTVQDCKWYLYDGTRNKFLKALQHSPGGNSNTGPITDSGAPRWDYKDPDVFYFAAQTSLRKYNAKTDAVTTIHDFKKDFPEATYLYLPAYGSQSADMRYWGFIVNSSYGEGGTQIAKITYDMKEDKILGKVPGDTTRLITISPSGKRVIVGGQRGQQYTTSYKLDFTDKVELISHLGHSDVALDDECNEVIVGGDHDTDWIIMQNIETGKITKLISFIHNTNWDKAKKTSGTGYHVSGNCYSTPGWAVISTYGYNYGLGEENTDWNSYVIYLLKLDVNANCEKPTIWRVAHNHSIWAQGAEKTYWAETHATINVKGDIIIFASNWDDANSPIETYRCDLPKGWYEKLMGADKAKSLKTKAAKNLNVVLP